MPNVVTNSNHIRTKIFVQLGKSHHWFYQSSNQLIRVHAQRCYLISRQNISSIQVHDVKSCLNIEPYSSQIHQIFLLYSLVSRFLRSSLAVRFRFWKRKCLNAVYCEETRVALPRRRDWICPLPTSIFLFEEDALIAPIAMLLSVLCFLNLPFWRNVLLDH